jgi:predicted enzyme related to lactoylglutathione lyase
MGNRRPTTYPGGELVMVLDCADLERTAAFWGAALGYWWKPLEDADGQYLWLIPGSGDGIELLLQRVPERKTVKNRMHLDLRVRDLGREIDRLCSLGARRLTTEPVRESGWVWHVLADPDGNELCVLEPPAEHWDRHC